MVFVKIKKGLQAYRIWARSYDLITNWRKNVPDETTTTVAGVKSAWTSKVNWAAFIGVLTAIVAFFGIDVPPDVQAQIQTAITAVTGLVVWFIRTFLTKDLTKASVKQ